MTRCEPPIDPPDPVPGRDMCRRCEGEIQLHEQIGSVHGNGTCLACDSEEGEK